MQRLTIDGLGSGQVGITFNSGGNLAIENCVVWNFAAGITISSGTSSSFSVSNTIASNNSGNGMFFAGLVTGVLSKVTANNNGVGVDVVSFFGAPNVTIVDSVASNNSNAGVEASPGTRFPTPSVVMLRNVVASNNGTGLLAGPGGTLRVAHSVITRNGTGVSTSRGSIKSNGDNDINGNTNDNFGALTTIPVH